MKAYLIQSPLGYGAVVIKENSISKLVIPSATKKQIESQFEILESTLPDLVLLLEKEISEYLLGKRTEFTDFDLDYSSLTAFQTEIYKKLRLTKLGELLSYKDLGDRCGRENSSRAVGMAMRKNPFHLLIPCHRVVSSKYELTGYSAPGGLETKRKLLEIEGSISKLR